MFSKACEYGIRATLFVAQQSKLNRRVSIKEISAEIDSPTAFTAKILQILVREGIVTSQKGPSGGFEIDDAKRESVTLSQVVTAIDGDRVSVACVLGLKQCGEAQPCPVHNQYVSIRKDIQNMLNKTNIASLADKLEDGLTFLKQ